MGVFALGVTLDYGLLIGSAVLGVVARALGTRRHGGLSASHLVPSR
jgi:hypothetical protein